MNNEDMLARLIAQASGEGVEPVTLRAIVEEASEVGARRMLERIGLDDEIAITDVSDLRQLLQAWRDAKTSALRAVAAWIMRGLLALLLIGLAVKLGFVDMLK